MSDPNAILDQAQAELRAGRKAEAWRLTAAIVKADPQNARAWRVLADISEKDAPERAAGYRAKAEAAEANARLGPPASASPAPGPTRQAQRIPAIEQPEPQQFQPQQGPPPGPYQQPPQYPASPHAPTQYPQSPQYARQAPRAAIAPPKRSLGATLVQVIIALLILAGAVVVISRGLRNTKRSAAPQSSLSATRTPLAVTAEILTGAELDAHFDRVATAVAPTAVSTPATTAKPGATRAPVGLGSRDELQAVFEHSPFAFQFVEEKEADEPGVTGRLAPPRSGIDIRLYGTEMVSVAQIRITTNALGIDRDVIEAAMVDFLQAAAPEIRDPASWVAEHLAPAMETGRGSDINAGYLLQIIYARDYLLLSLMPAP